MPANWTQPATWTVNQLVTADDLNEQLRDNLEFLKDPPSGAYMADESANYSTTSSTFVDVDATNFALSLTTAGGDVLVGFYGTMANAGVGGRTFFDVDVSTSGRIGGDDGLITVQNPDASSGDRVCVVSFVYLLTGLAAGTHEFSLQWKALVNTATLYAGAGTSNVDVHPQFWAREI